MRTFHHATSLVTALLLAACAASTSSGSRSRNDARDLSAPSAKEANDADGDDDGDEVRIGADEIPAAIRDAAIAALPGLTITEAEIEEAGSVYCVHGTVDGKFREVEVTTAGLKATIEPEEDDEDGEKDD